MRQMNHIIRALLAMNGRITMLGISRWAGTGGSYRTIFRFFHTVIPWSAILWTFFHRHLWCPKDTYLLVGDEVVISKAGKITYGLDRFFSSLVNKPILGLSFFTLSLVSIEKRHSFPMQIKQIDLELSYEKVIDYYKLRFQIEFNFRDGKQFWGLEDFMNQKEIAVTNAVNLSFFMVNLSDYLLTLLCP